MATELKKRRSVDRVAHGTYAYGDDEELIGERGIFKATSDLTMIAVQFHDVGLHEPVGVAWYVLPRAYFDIDVDPDDVSWPPSFTIKDFDR